MEQLTRTALNAIEGFKAFQKGTKNRDDFPETGDTEDCFPEYTNLERECREREERGEDRYRTFDGTCNNLNEVIKIMSLSKPFSMACGKINDTHWNILPQYTVVQKNSFMFEFPAFLPPINLELPMHSPSALTEHVSLNLARFFFARPCSVRII